MAGRLPHIDAVVGNSVVILTKRIRKASTRQEAYHVVSYDASLGAQESSRLPGLNQCWPVLRVASSGSKHRIVGQRAHYRINPLTQQLPLGAETSLHAWDPEKSSAPNRKPFKIMEGHRLSAWKNRYIISLKTQHLRPSTLSLTDGLC